MTSSGRSEAMSDSNSSKHEGEEGIDAASNVKDHSQTVQSSASEDVDEKDDSQLQKDTAAASISADIVTMNDGSSNKSRDKVDDEGEVLLLIPKIIRSLVERSRHAEELVREGMIDFARDLNNDNGQPRKESNDCPAAKQSPPATTTKPSKASLTTNGNLLNLPPSWKRSNYASKTLSEIEEYIAKSNSSKSNNLHHEKSTSFNVEYNECSLLALANWTMMDTAASNHKSNGEKQKQNRGSSATFTTTTSPATASATTTAAADAWKQYKREQEKLRATSTTKYNMPIPPPSAFRMCGVCGCFGHYEMECDLLVSYNDDGNNAILTDGDDNGDGGDEVNEKKGRKRKRLGGESKQEVISRLAKEIRIQRTLQTLLTNARSEEGAKTETMTKSSKEDDDDDASYWVTSQRCNICLSALGDESMLVCDGCDELYHMQCLDPPLHSVPEGDWFCDACQAYDDEVSSTVDLEGCGDFVIEQRKRSVAEEERRRRDEEDYVGVSIGGDNPWVAALSILTQKEPNVENIANFNTLYMRRDEDGESGRTEFVADEVVWAKRQVGRIKYWPGIVSKVAKKGLDVKYFPLSDINLDRLHHQSELLPFFPYFEDLGYDQMMTNDLFRRALEVSVIKTGLKTLGQALNFARCGPQMSFHSGTNEFRNTDAARALKSAGWVAPIGWENAEIDEVDGVMIVARADTSNDCNRGRPRPNTSINSPIKSDECDGVEIDSDECEICHLGGDLLICDGGDNGGGCDKVFHVACIERDEIPPGDWICMECANELGFNVGVEGHEWGSDDALEKTDTQNNVRAEFRVDEIVGSIVSWQQLSNPKTCYGVVLSVNVKAKSALLRAIPVPSDSVGSYQQVVQANNSIQIQARDIGSTMWMPLNHLSFVAGRAAEKDSNEFTETLVSHMKDELESFETRCREAEIQRERFMVELSLPAPDDDDTQSSSSHPDRSDLRPSPSHSLLNPR